MLETTNLHLYAPKYRPPDSFTVPRGFTLIERGSRVDCAPLRTDLLRGSTPFGIVGYERELTADEVATYELAKV